MDLVHSFQSYKYCFSLNKIKYSLFLYRGQNNGFTCKPWGGWLRCESRRKGENYVTLGVADMRFFPTRGTF